MSFLLTGFDFSKLKIEIIDIAKTINTVSPININYIEIMPEYNSDITTELTNWIHKHIIYKKSNIYKFIEVPLLIPIYINRNDNINILSIDIPKKIKFPKCKDCDELVWTFHSIVCCSGSDDKSYYSVVKLGEKQWYVFNNANIPSITKIKISDQLISSKIKKESTLVFYKLSSLD